jgi:hypothetical protein
MDQTTQETSADNNAPDKINREFQDLLLCPMDPSDREWRNARLRQLLDTIDNETAEMDAAKKLAKAKIEEHEAELKRVRLELNQGKLDKPVRCEEQFFYRVGLVRIVRTDTGEVIDSRAMTVAERQPSLPLGDSDASDVEVEPDDEDSDGDEGDETEAGEGGGDDDEPPPELESAKGEGSAGKGVRKRKSKSQG